jgi:hypothetical protein
MLFLPIAFGLHCARTHRSCHHLIWVSRMNPEALQIFARLQRSGKTDVSHGQTVGEQQREMGAGEAAMPVWGTDQPA